MVVLPGDVGAGEAVHGGDELLLAARHDPSVDVGGGAAGDDVDLVSGVQHRRVGAVADGGPDQGRGRAEPVEQRVHVGQVGGQVLQGGEFGDRGPYGVGDPDRPAVLADPGDGGGEPADRVGAVDLGAVSRRAVRGELHPGGAALAGRDRVDPQGVARVEGVGAGLADALGAAFEEIGVLLDEVTGAVGGAVLFVGGEGEHDVADRARSGAGPGADGGEHHRVHVLHVDGTAAPDHAVADLAGERRHAPVGRLGGDHVEVTVHQQRVGRRIGAGDAGDDIRPARGGLQDARFDAGVGELPRDVFGGEPLVAVAATAVGGVDPDQVGGERHHLVQRPGVEYRRPVDGRDDLLLLSHTAPPRPARRGW